MSTIPARRVLIAADLSPVTARAAGWARAFAAPRASVEALFVYDPPPSPVFGMPVPPMSKAEKTFLVKRLTKAVPGSSVKVETGRAPARILARARRSGLVVMGSHGRTGFQRAFLGSTAEIVVRNSAVPVLVVRTPARPVRSVLAPVNLMPYSYRGLLLAAETAAHLGARLDVLHVAPDKNGGPNPKFFLNGMIARLPKPLKAAVTIKVVQRAGEPVREILAEASRHGLVVMTAHRKSLLTDIVLGTTVERVLRHSPVPVLAAPSAR